MISTLRNPGCSNVFKLHRFLYALRQSKLCHISRSGCKTCRIPAGPMDDADRFWTGLVESSLDLNRFAGMLKARRTDLKDDSRLDRIPAFFLHGVLYIWRFLYKPASVMEVKGTNMVEALPAAAEVYVSEWLKNVDRTVAIFLWHWLRWAARAPGTHRGLPEILTSRGELFHKGHAA